MKVFIRGIKAIACLLLAMAAGCAGAGPTGAGAVDLPHKTLQVGDLTRHYWLYLPKGAQPQQPLPVVFVLHGGGGPDAENLLKRFGFNEIADREGFIVVYPRGVDGQWNDGRERSLRPGKDIAHVDDVGFISAVIDELIREYGVDADRIYVTGLSNGGMMTHRLGIELGTRIAAIAPLVSNIPVKIADRKPESALSVLIMNGTEDPIVPWEGGQVGLFALDFGGVLSTRESVRYWLEANGISSEPEESVLPDKVPDDGCRVRLLAYHKKGSPLEVLLYRLEGSGHNIPGDAEPHGLMKLGRNCRDIDTARVIWAFFKGHSRLEAGRSPARSAVGI